MENAGYPIEDPDEAEFAGLLAGGTTENASKSASYGFKPSGWPGERISANRLPITIASF